MVIIRVYILPNHLTDNSSRLALYGHMINRLIHQLSDYDGVITFDILAAPLETDKLFPKGSLLVP